MSASRSARFTWDDKTRHGADPMTIAEPGRPISPTMSATGSDYRCASC